MAPSEILLGGLRGKEQCACRRNLEEAWSALASNLVDLNPYMKKSSLESALQLMDQENKGVLRTLTLAQCGNPIHPHTCLEGAPHEKLEERTQFQAQSA